MKKDASTVALFYYIAKHIASKEVTTLDDHFTE